MTTPTATRRARLAAALRTANEQEAANRLAKLLRPDPRYFYLPNGVERPAEEYAKAAVPNLLACDPTPRKKYAPWLAKIFNAGHVSISGLYATWHGGGGQLILPEDAAKVRDALALLERFRTAPALRGVNVMALDWRGLDDAAEKLRGQAAKPDVAPTRLEGAEIALDEGPWKVWRVPKLDGGPGDQAKEKALRTLGLGTQWCTRDDYPDCMARTYLRDGDVFVAFKSGAKVAQFNLAEESGFHAMDVRDRAIDFGKDPELGAVVLGTLERAGAVTPATARQLVDRFPGQREALEARIARSPRGAADYATETLQHAWPPGEPAIATDAAASYKYAREIFNGRWPPGEPAIAADGKVAAIYANNVVKGRWPEAEPIIAKNPGGALRYARDVVEGRWPPGEAAVATDGPSAMLYARDVVQGRWPPGEPAILASPEWYSKFDYLERCVEGPWPELEAKILALPIGESRRSLLWRYQAMVEHLSGGNVAFPPEEDDRPPTASRRARLAARLVRVANPAAEAANRLLKLLRLPEDDWAEGKSAERLPAIVAALLACDPTPRKRYVPWLAKLANGGLVKVTGPDPNRHLLLPRDYQLILPEDAPKVREAISLLERFRTGLNVMGMDWYAVEDATERLKAEKNKPDLAPGELPGATVVVDRDGWKIFEVGRLAGDKGDADRAKEQALRTLGAGTRWCTRDDYSPCQAEGYLRRGPVFVALRGGRKEAQFHVEDGRVEIMDAADRPIDLQGDAAAGIRDAVRGALLASGDPAAAGALVRLAVDGRARDPEIERKLMGHPLQLARYAFEFFHGRRWPEAEPVIVRDGRAALLYALNNRDRDRWPEAEPAIAEDAYAASQYAELVLRERWAPAEAALLRETVSKDEGISGRAFVLALDYMKRLVYGPWPELFRAVAKLPRRDGGRWYAQEYNQALAEIIRHAEARAARGLHGRPRAEGVSAAKAA